MQKGDYRSSDVWDTDTGGKQPRLWVQEHFLDMWPLELSRSSTSLVRPQSLDGLITLVIVGPETSGAQIGSHFPPYDGSGDDSDQTGGKIDGLPWSPCVTDDMAESVGD